MKNKNSWWAWCSSLKDPLNLFSSSHKYVVQYKICTNPASYTKNIVLPRFSQFLHNFDGELENEQIVSLWAERRQFMKDSVAVEKGAGKAKKSHQHRSYHKNLFLISFSLDIFTQPKKESEKPPAPILSQKTLFDIL